MKNEEIIERYIYASTKNLPSKIKKDVADELNSIISDMLEERTGDVTPAEHDVRVVLTELGTPQELSQKYSPDSDKCLIGAPYYSQYKFVLKIVMACVLFGTTLAQIIASITDGTIWYAALGSWLASTWISIAFAFTFVTLLFAFFYHKNIDINSALNSIDNLPPVPQKNEKISKWDAVFGIIFSIVFVFIFLVTPQIFCAVFTEAGKFIPVFDTQVIRSTWYIIIAFGALGIIKESVKLIEGRYTLKVAVVTAVTNLASIVLSSVWLINYKIINPDFLKSFIGLFDGKDIFIINIFEKSQYFFLAIIIFSLLLDILTVTVKAIKSSSK